VAIAARGRANLELAPGILAKLQSLFVAVNPIFPAEHPGPFTLPIFSGALAPNGAQGCLEFQGALEFIQLGGGQVFWREPSLDFTAKSLNAEVDLEPSPPFGGKLGAIQIASLVSASFSSDPKARTIAVTGAALAINAQTAQAFNEIFAKPQGKLEVFSAGEALGTMSFVAAGK
jgi:hypothetical protein